jgi:hypothetical protein
MPTSPPTSRPRFRPRFRLLAYGTLLAALIYNGVSGAQPRSRPAPASPCTGAPMYARAQLARYAPEPRLVPELRDGHVTGMRVHSLRPGHWLAQLGVHTGDVMTRVADVEITSPAALVEGYARVRTRSCSTIAVDRDGKALELSFKIR